MRNRGRIRGVQLGSQKSDIRKYANDPTAVLARYEADSQSSELRELANDQQEPKVNTFELSGGSRPHHELDAGHSSPLRQNAMHLNG